MSNSLSAVHPELVAEWSDRNLPLTPDSITFGQNKKVWWKGACGHEWETSVKARSNGEKCPICSGARVVTGINDLSTLKPELASEWSDKNEKKPTEVMAFANSKAWWKCRTCGYEWNTLISTRSGGSKCPCCSGYTFIKGRNDLKSTHPQIAKEWSEKNYPLQPDEVNAKSRKNAWWQCRYGHSWSMKINECTVLGKGCRICEQEYVSEGYKVVCKIKEVENNTRVILCDLLNKRKP